MATGGFLGFRCLDAAGLKPLKQLAAIFSASALGVVSQLMADIGTLIEGAALAGVGAFMVLAPKSADSLNRAVPFVRLGGPLGPAFGYLALIVGSGLIAAWLIENIWLLHSN